MVEVGTSARHSGPRMRASTSRAWFSRDPIDPSLRGPLGPVPRPRFEGTEERLLHAILCGSCIARDGVNGAQQARVAGAIETIEIVAVARPVRGILLRIAVDRHHPPIQRLRRLVTCVEAD